METAITILPFDESHLDQVTRIDGEFTVDQHLVLEMNAGRLTWSMVAVPPYTKQFPGENFDWTPYARRSDRAWFVAAVDGRIAGHIRLRETWNRYGAIEEIVVDGRFRRQGIGRRLLDAAIDWTRGRGLPGLMAEAQDNNAGACRFYARCGFHLGGFDREFYRGQDPETDEIALFWYLIF